MSKLSDAKKITLGADPEFCFVKNGRLVCAENLLNAEGGREEDENGNENNDFFVDPDGEFGLDGCQDIAELRPKPSADPYVLVENIRKALAIGYTKVPDLKTYKWIANPSFDDYPMGGHIHLGFRDLPAGAFNPRLSNSNMSELLDLYLGVPGILAEPEDEGERRRGDYGGFGDYRQQPWGMEYRTLGTWLSHPAVALSVLCLAKTVAVEGVMHGRALGAVSARERKTLYDLGTSDRAALKKELLPIVYTRLTKFELYPLYKNEIGFLLDMVHANKSMLTRSDMKETWGLSQFAPKKIVKPAPKKLSELFSARVRGGRGLAARLSAQAREHEPGNVNPFIPTNPAGVR